MYNQRRRKIIILIFVIIIVLAILGIGGYFAYAKTDLLKSNKTLFFKYASEVIDSIKLIEDAQLKEIYKQKEEKTHITEAKLTLYSENESKNVGIGMQAAVDTTEKQEYRNFGLLQNSEKIFEVEYAKSNNIFALKSGEIVNAFLGVENDNLRVLAQKLGVKDTNNIPNKIEESYYNVDKLLEITEEEKTHLQEVYTSAIQQAIDDSCFSKEKNFAVARDGINYNTTAYRLTLTAEQTKQTAIYLLQTLKEDSITLNLIATRAAQYDLGEDYTDINKLTELIQKEIDNINNLYEFPSLSIMIYVDNMKVITTEIIYNNEMKYTVYGQRTENSNSRYLLIENLSADTDISKIVIKENDTVNNTNSNYNVSINLDDKININTNAIIKNSNSIASIDVKNEITVDNNEFNVDFSEKTQFIDDVSQYIVKLDRNNCGVLNDYTTEQLQALIQAVMQRTKEVLEIKTKTISDYISSIMPKGDTGNTRNSVVQNVIENEETLNQLSEQEVKAFNAKFEPYKGKIDGVKLKALRTTIENSNLTDMENQVTLYIDGERSFADNINIEPTNTYNVEMQYESDTGFITQINATAY